MAKKIFKKLAIFSLSGLIGLSSLNMVSAIANEDQIIAALFQKFGEYPTRVIRALALDSEIPTEEWRAEVYQLFMALPYKIRARIFFCFCKNRDEMGIMEGLSLDLDSPATTTNLVRIPKTNRALKYDCDYILTCILNNMNAKFEFYGPTILAMLVPAQNEAGEKIDLILTL